MKKFLIPIVVAILAAVFAGALYIRVNGGRDVNDAQPELSETSGAYLYYAVRSDDESNIYAYFPDGTVHDASNYDGVLQTRFNQSTNLCDKPGGVAALWVQCENEDDVLRLVVNDGVGQNKKTVLETTIDPRELGVTPSASEGYLLPVAVADDKSAVYLGRRVETESYVAGLWKLDLATGDVSEIAYVRENSIYYYDINPATKQLVGVTFVPPESLGEYATGPFRIAFVDLSNGEGAVLREQQYLPYENPMFSQDGRSFAYYEDGNTMIGTVGADGDSDAIAFHGVAKDWFGDTVVFDRDGNLFLYDLATRTETKLTHETEAYVEYLGVMR